MQADMLNAEQDKCNRSVNILAVKSNGAAGIHPQLFLPLCNNWLVALTEVNLSQLGKQPVMHASDFITIVTLANKIGKKKFSKLQKPVFLLCCHCTKSVQTINFYLFIIFVSVQFCVYSSCAREGHKTQSCLGKITL